MPETIRLDHAEQEEPLVAEDVESKTYHSANVAKATTRVSFWKRTSYVLGALSLLEFFVIVMAIFSPSRAKPSYETGFRTDFDDAKAHIGLEEVSFGTPILPSDDGKFYMREEPGERKYVGRPSPEIDEAWEELIGKRYIRFNEAEIAKLNAGGDSLRPIPETKWTPIAGTYGGVDVLHSLHCLNALRKQIHSDYYEHHMPYDQSTELMQMHIDHCVSQLRQTLMCSADLTPVTLRPVITHYHNSSQFFLLGETERTHTCRNFNALRKWNTERADRDGTVHTHHGL